MISYELAKKLKDAGFQFKEWYLECHSGEPSTLQWDNKDWEFPTLSELIEACGEDFLSLTLFLPNPELREELNTQTRWQAQGRFETTGPNKKSCKVSYGSTPEEAVENLWLALNKK